jgi:hypothetical protein
MALLLNFILRRLKGGKSMSLGQKGGEETISQELGIARIEAIL